MYTVLVAVRLGCLPGQVLYSLSAMPDQALRLQSPCPLTAYLDPFKIYFLFSLLVHMRLHYFFFTGKYSITVLSGPGAPLISLPAAYPVTDCRSPEERRAINY